MTIIIIIIPLAKTMVPEILVSHLERSCQKRRAGQMW